MDKSEVLSPVFQVPVSATEPPFRATVLALTPVGTPETVTVMVSSVSSAAEPADVAESTVTLILTSAPKVVVSVEEPTTVREVWPPGPTDTDIEAASGVALTGETAEVRPNPKAATVTSAKRLSVVFVDIDFLSLVELETIPSSARQREKLFTW